MSLSAIPSGEPGFTRRRGYSVGRALSSYREYCDTHIEGVRQLPLHWRIKPLKHVVRINPDELSDSTDPDYEIQYIDIGNVTLIDGVTGSENIRFERAPAGHAGESATVTLLFRLFAHI